jgi:hypothetical protein
MYDNKKLPLFIIKNNYKLRVSTWASQHVFQQRMFLTAPLQLYLRITEINN